MTDERLDELWETMSSATQIKQVEYGTAVTIGSVFGEMKKEIVAQRDEIERLDFVIKKLSGGKKKWRSRKEKTI